MWKKLSINCLSCVFIILLSAYLTTSQSDAEKSGVCPEFTIPTSDLCVIECNKDSECPGETKCCSLISCGSICTSPVLPTASTKQVNVSNSTDSESNKCKNECDNSRQCGSGSLCIRDGCKRICKSFSSKKKPVSNRKQSKDTSPLSLLSQIPRRMRRRNCTDQCLRDVHCDFGYKCVPVGCRNVCERHSSGTNNIRTPTTKSQVDECNDRCVRDIHCPFGYECVPQGCRKNCLRTTTTIGKASSKVKLGLTRSSFPTSQRSSDCHQICSRDSDCPQNKICAQQGCNTFCAQQTVTASQSPAHASLSRGEQHATEDCKSECVGDIDCNIGLYCRRRGCKRVCKQGHNNGNKELVAPERNKVQGSNGNCKNECYEDLDCSFGFQCRQQGCKRVCRSDHHTRQGSMQTSSALRCQNECENELDCPIGYLCAKKGCKNECKKTFVTNTTPPQDCSKECVGTRNCNLGYICVKIGCKTACQRYQASQNSQPIKGTKSNCLNECNRNSDCTAGNICVHDGCNKICSRNTITSQETKRQDKQGKQSPILSNRCHDQCSKDSDCSSNSLCAQRGCRRMCISIFNSMSSGFTSPFSRNGRIK